MGRQEEPKLASKVIEQNVEENTTTVEVTLAIPRLVITLSNNPKEKS